MITLALLACTGPSTPLEGASERATPPLENENSIGVVMLVARGAWRTPIDFEDPVALTEIAYDYQALERPTSLVPLELIHQGQSAATGLEAALASYNMTQTTRSVFAHVQYELFREGDRLAVRASQVWDGEQWKPARLLLDETIQFEDRRASCSSLVKDVVDQAIEQCRDCRAGWSRVRPRVNWGSFSLDVPCRLDGAAPARQHLAALRRQVEAANGGTEPWFTEFAIYQGPSEGLDVTGFRVALSPLDKAEATYDGLRFVEGDELFGYRRERSAERPPPVREPRRKLIP